MRTLFKIFGIILIFLVGGFAYVGWRTDSFLKEQCEYLASTAENESNIEYIKHWVNDVALANKYQKVWSNDQHTVAIFNGEISYISSPDWETVGLDPKHAHLRLVKVAGKYEELLSTENIETIEYGRGRDSVVIKVNHPGPLNIRNKPESGSHFKKITDQVFVYCDGARF
ncbi:hypothetical protein [Litoribrevibacter albus]|uniref:Uncharacterized protein n=1 Tax=Litoribrevibacter albus TaxID=1473156 RepID=A0AA37SC49_9GAMM|nr:hypothetical protein [Litoribrevibacter albus]GLQ32003.1 hypothetical protein GCM10007876_24820 [Litoribrevibacter albus]